MHKWIRLEPDVDDEGDQCGWNLVVEWDNDWQGWSLDGVSAGGVRLKVYVTDEMIAEIRDVCPA